MKICICHYHLHPGGVTRIIQSQAATLVRKGYHVKVLCGDCGDPSFFLELGVDVIVRPELNYLPADCVGPEWCKEAEKRYYLVLKEVVGKEDVLHFHNLNLGKNPLVTYVVYLLAQEGYLVVNHAHDFAEDRPHNMSFLGRVIEEYLGEADLQKVMYPEMDNYVFAVLNSFDLKRLERLGIHSRQRFFLPNPVDIPSSVSISRQAARQEVSQVLGLNPEFKWITYPVRVIQRKNIGEYILWALLMQSQAHFLVTQPPRNPVEVVRYQKWVTFCKELNIPMVFEAGQKVDFVTLLTASDFCMTTSYQEGFGMAFLEPWLMDIPVIGRDISYVTGDMKEEGIEFPLLYQEFLVPYQKHWMDFGELKEEVQRTVLVEVSQGRITLESLMEKNPFLKEFPPQVEQSLIKRNKDSVLATYSGKRYGERLHEIYCRFT